MAVPRRLCQYASVLLFMITVILLYRLMTQHRLEQQLRIIRAHHKPHTRVKGKANPSTSKHGSLIGSPQNLSSHVTQSEHSRVVVIPRMKNEDISWIDTELPDVNIVSWVVNDVSAPTHPPKNKGHEVMIYFSFIIDHYHRLPDIVIFMHAHRWTHHNNELLGFDASQMIRRLNGAYVARRGYANMRCHWDPGCPDWLRPDRKEESMGKQEEAVLAQCWNELFPTSPLPESLSQPCCAQFALSRDRIHSIPLGRYTFYRDWILRTPLSDYISGRIWEYTWQFLFTNHSNLCPAEHLCYCDGFGVCFGGEAEYRGHMDRLRLKREYVSEADFLRKSRGSGGKMASESGGGRPSDQDRLARLETQIQAMEKELVAKREDALERGKDPRQRAAECGREWKEGDGF